MSAPPGARERPPRRRGGLTRLFGAWRELGPDQRLAATAALGLLLSMFLPWYEKNVIPPGGRTLQNDSVSAFGVLSFVEAAVFLVSAGVLLLLFARAERRAFHLPGGDGTIVFVAGLWAALLLFYRVFDRPDVKGAGGTVGIQWGFFVAFVAAGALAYAGRRIRAAHRPEPPLPYERGEPPAGAAPAPAEPRRAPASDAPPAIAEPATAVTRRVPREPREPRQPRESDEPRNRAPRPEGETLTEQLSLEDPPPPPDLRRRS
jgi:hypothetical protein